MKKTVVVGMSGGVDSSVAAYLLKKEGYQVIGVTMEIWRKESTEEIEDKGGCCGLTAAEDARKVAGILDIPHYVLNFRDVFKEKVMDYFAKEYLSGKTPNPCIACNRYVKWEALLEKALAMGADYIATGHYAHVVENPNGRLTLQVADFVHKDQTYALYSLTQRQLRHTLMPLGKYEKREVRKIAGELGLCVANKPDSQEICFIPGHNHGVFLEEYTGKSMEPGDFVDASGNKLGRHRGVGHYTIGQRKGLGIALGQPVFVQSIDAANNRVVLGEDHELFRREVMVGDVNFMGVACLEEPIACMGKIRYSHAAAQCVVSPFDGGVTCFFDQPQRAVTPGQAAVFYREGRIVCGGTIQ